MGSRLARQLCGLAVFILHLAASGFAAATASAADTWPQCFAAGEDDNCLPLYLNVTTAQGSASLTVERTCTSDWRHAWRQADARQAIRQWIDGAAASASGALCIPLSNQVTEVRAVPLGGHCGYAGMEINTPGPGGVMRQGGLASLSLIGCHARIQDLTFGGVALRFADGYGFGDSYATGYFYGVYDGFGNRAVGPTGASVWRISDFNTFHYQVEILAGGSPDWRQPLPEEDHGR